MSRVRVLQLLAERRIPEARKIGHHWIIPASAAIVRRASRGRSGAIFRAILDLLASSAGSGARANSAAAPAHAALIRIFARRWLPLQPSRRISPGWRRRSASCGRNCVPVSNSALSCTAEQRFHLRSEKKDYQDIAAMIRAGCLLAQGLAAARLLFGNALQPAACLKALTYFKDGDLGKLSGADRNTLIKAAKSVRALPRIALRSKKLAGA